MFFAYSKKRCAILIFFLRVRIDYFSSLTPCLSFLFFFIRNSSSNDFIENIENNIHNFWNQDKFLSNDETHPLQAKVFFRVSNIENPDRHLHDNSLFTAEKAAVGKIPFLFFVFQILSTVEENLPTCWNGFG